MSQSEAESAVRPQSRRDLKALLLQQQVFWESEALSVQVEPEVQKATPEAPAMREQSRRVVKVLLLYYQLLRKSEALSVQVQPEVQEATPEAPAEREAQVGPEAQTTVRLPILRIRQIHHSNTTEAADITDGNRGA